MVATRDRLQFTDFYGLQLQMYNPEAQFGMPEIIFLFRLLLLDAQFGIQTSL